MCILTQVLVCGMSSVSWCVCALFRLHPTPLPWTCATSEASPSRSASSSRGLSSTSWRPTWFTGTGTSCTTIKVRRRRQCGETPAGGAVYLHAWNRSDDLWPALHFSPKASFIVFAIFLSVVEEVKPLRRLHVQSLLELQQHRESAAAAQLSCGEEHPSGDLLSTPSRFLGLKEDTG